MSELLSLVPEHGFSRFFFDAVWQSTVIGLFAVAALKIFVRRPAARSWLAVLACVLCVVAPCATLAARSFGIGFLPTAGVPPVSSAVVTIGDGVGGDDVRFPKVASDELTEPPSEEAVASVSEAERSTTNSPEPAAAALPSSSSVRPGLSNPWRLNLMVLLAAMWCAVAAVLLIRFGKNVLAVLKVCRDARRCEDAVLLQSSERAASLLHLPRVPEVLVSERTSCPAVVSWFRTKLIVPPVKRVLGQDQWVAVFAHELAHVQRRDGWSRVLTELAVVVMPWQPMLWWLRRAYHESSEHACDDWAIFAGADPLDYASTLTDWIPRQQPTLAPGIGGWPHLIRRRINRLLKDRATVNPRLGSACRFGTTAMAFTALGLIALLQQGSFSAIAGTDDSSVVADSTGAEAIAVRPNVFGDGRLSHWNAAKVLGFSADSRAVISSSRDRTLMVWNTESGEAIGHRTLPMNAGGGWRDWPLDVRGRFSTDEIVTPDGRSLVQSMANGEIRVVDITRGSFRTLEYRVELPRKLTLSGDGTTLAVLRMPTESQSAIDIIDFESGQLIRTFDREEDRRRGDRWQGITLSPNGRLLAAGRRECVSVFNTANGEELWHEQADPAASKSGMAGVLCFSPNGTKLASGGWVRDARTGDELAKIKSPARLKIAVSRSLANHIAFDPTGELLAMTNGQSLWVWDTVEKRQRWSVTSRSGVSYSSVRFSPDRQLLAAACGNEIVLHSVESGERTSASETARVQSLAVSPTDSQLLLGLTTGQIESVELDSRTAVLWDAHEHPVEKIVFSPDGNLAASATSGQLVTHDPRSAAVEHQFESSPQSRSPRNPRRPIAFSADGSQLFAFPAQPDRDRNKIERWSVSGEPLAPLKVSSQLLSLYGLTPTSQGELLMLSMRPRPTLTAWDGATGDHVFDLQRLFPRAGGPVQVDVSRDDKKIAFGARAEGFRVFVRAAARYVDLRKGHRRGTLRALAFHPGGRLLASAAEDGRVVVWDTDTRQKLTAIRVGPLGGVINDLGWTSDGSSLVTGNANGTASMHSVDAELLLADVDSDPRGEPTEIAAGK